MPDKQNLISRMQFPEITTPTALTDHWAYYGKADNKPYFQDGAGVEHEISLQGSDYGEMYIANNASATACASATTWYEVSAGFTTGVVEGVTFDTNKLVAPHTGLYRVMWAASSSAATINDIFQIGISIDDATPMDKTIIRRKYGNIDVGASSGMSILSLTGGQYVKLEVYNETAGRNITISWCNMQLVKI